MSGRCGVPKDYVVIRFSEEEINSLAGTIAESLFAAIYERAVQQYPWNAPLVAGLEAVADNILNIAATKFYQRCS